MDGSQKRRHVCAYLTYFLLGSNNNLLGDSHEALLVACIQMKLLCDRVQPIRQQQIAKSALINNQLLGGARDFHRHNLKRQHGASFQSAIC